MRDAHNDDHDMTKRFVLLAVLLALAVAHAPAVAASFDCSKAKLPREKIICGDANLSELDGKLGATYKEKLAMLSPRGALQFRRSEESWIAYSTKVCPSRASAETSSLRRTPQQCLENEYRRRINQLMQIRRLGPFVLNRIDLYAVMSTTAGDESGMYPGFSTKQVGYPQIDADEVPGAKAWNEQVMKTLVDADDCESDGDAAVDYEIGLANEKFISTRWSNFTYCHGTPHGMWSTKVENIVLLPVLREVQASDLFGNDYRWTPKFEELVLKHLADQNWAGAQSRDDARTEEVLRVAVVPDHWEFTSEGLVIAFSAYEGGCYTCTPREPVSLSWDEIKPMLISNSPIP